jgi:hypothetical protein
MRQGSALITAVVVLVAIGGFGVFQSVAGQEFETTTIVCGPCAGEPFGASGSGLVVLRAPTAAASPDLHEVRRTL